MNDADNVPPRDENRAKSQPLTEKLARHDSVALASEFEEAALHAAEFGCVCWPARPGLSASESREVASALRSAAASRKGGARRAEQPDDARVAQALAIDDFVRGFSCALAELVKVYDQPGMAAEVARSCGITVAVMESAKIDAADLRLLRRAFRGENRNG